MAVKRDNNLHDGHKARFRKRFAGDKCDFENFSDYEILEFILSYVIVRQNTNELAHRLINRFQTLKGVLSAELDQLKEINGVGERTAVFLKAQHALLRKYMKDEYTKMAKQENSMGDLLLFIKSLFTGKNLEEFHCIMYDRNRKMIDHQKLCSGSESAVRVDTKETVKLILDRHASYVIFTHNHPGGTAIASQEDWEITKNLEKLLQCLEVEMIDHMIVAGHMIVSMKQNKKYIMDDASSGFVEYGG